MPYSGQEVSVSIKQPILFWDEHTQDYRGVRALFHTVPQEWENRQVEQRLQDRMTTYLSHYCEQVITLESFRDARQQIAAQQVLAELVSQWKIHNRINPQYLFASLPFLDVDMVVLMERTHYEQVWKRKDKYLMLGVNLSVFELEDGVPIYGKPFYDEILWQGEHASHTRAEQAVLLPAANALGNELKQIAAQVNRAHEEEVRRIRAEQLAQERARLLQLKEENQALSRLVKNAEAELNDQQSVSPQGAALENAIHDLKELLRIPPTNLTAEQVEERHDLAQLIEKHLQKIQRDSAAKAVPAEAGTSSPTRPVHKESESAVKKTQGSLSAPSDATTGTQQQRLKTDITQPMGEQKIEGQPLDSTTQSNGATPPATPLLPEGKPGSIGSGT